MTEQRTIPMTDKMLERAARALCAEDFDPSHPAYPVGPECMYYTEDEAREAYVEVNWRATVPLVRAVLDAIREPGEGVCRAVPGYECKNPKLASYGEWVGDADDSGTFSPAAVFTTMIDAILSEEEGLGSRPAPPSVPTEKADEPVVVIDQIGGWCPVQAEGTINGAEFYFRARGQRWRIGIGGDVVMKPDWALEEPYGSERFEAGYMPLDEARAFIDKAARLYAEETASPAEVAVFTPEHKRRAFDLVRPPERHPPFWSLGYWMSAALDDPAVCEAMKADIHEWFDGGGHRRTENNQ